MRFLGHATTGTTDFTEVNLGGNSVTTDKIKDLTVGSNDLANTAFGHRQVLDHLLGIAQSGASHAPITPASAICTRSRFHSTRITAGRKRI